MGAGASSLPRLRKALLMKAYNSRKQDDLTLFDQFLPFAHQKEDSAYYIHVTQVKTCLGLENNKDYAFLDDLLYALFHKSPYSNHHNAEPSTGEARDIYFYDFIQFLETGKVPSYNSADEMKNNNTNTRNLPGPDVKKKSSTTTTTTPSTSSTRSSTPPKSANTASVKSSPGRPPQPPRCNDVGGGSGAEAQQQQRSHNNNNAEEEEEVIQINLSRIPSSSSSFKISSSSNSVVDTSDSKSVGSHNDPDSLEIIIRPAKQGLGGQLAAPSKQLWRKREVVRQEKSVHYTTVDENGELQELVEKETTQTEVLHMECRDTGEFAHREITQYEQLETFNEEVVNVVRGNEEYVHLKSLEDEFHFMDSNMPPKERDDRELAEEEEAARRAQEEAEEGHRVPRYYYDPAELPPDCDPNDPHDPRNDPAYRMETSSYHGGEEGADTPYSRYADTESDYRKEPVGAKDRSYLFEQHSPDAAKYEAGDYFNPAEDNANEHAPPPSSSFKARSQSCNPDNISPLSDVFFEQHNKDCPEVVLPEPDVLNQTTKLNTPEPVVVLAADEAASSDLLRATSYESMHDID